jgi:hypothetical protein
MSVDVALLPYIGDALTELMYTWQWEQVGGPVADIVDDITRSVNEWYSQMLIGTVQLWLTIPPDGWLVLDGTTYAIADYPELADVLPTALISGSNFTLPDASGAFPYHVSDGADSGVVVGANTISLTVAQLPPHSHSYVPPVLDVDLEAPGAPDIAAARLGTPTQTGSTGSGDDIDIRPLRLSLVMAIFAGRS